MPDFKQELAISQVDGATYWLMLALRNAEPRRMPLAWAEFATLRQSLLKIGARVVEKAARIRIHFASAWRRCLVQPDEPNAAASRPCSRTSPRSNTSPPTASHTRPGARRPGGEPGPEPPPDNMSNVFP